VFYPRHKKPVTNVLYSWWKRSPNYKHNKDDTLQCAAHEKAIPILIQNEYASVYTGRELFFSSLIKHLTIVEWIL